MAEEMKFSWHQFKYVVQSVLLVGFLVGALFLFEHKWAPPLRIAICWAVLLFSLVVVSFIQTNPKVQGDRFSPLRLMSTVMSTFGGVGMVHFLKGDDVGDKQN